MRRTSGGSRYAMPLRIKPDLGQRPENNVQPPSKQRCHVLQHNDSRSELSNHANGLEKQSASLTRKSCPKSGVGNILAGEAAADDIDSPFAFGWWKGSNVVPSSGVGPMLGENSLAVFVDFDLPLTTQTRPFKTQIEATYTSEQTAES